MTSLEERLTGMETDGCPGVIGMLVRPRSKDKAPTIASIGITTRAPAVEWRFSITNALHLVKANHPIR
jgi:hypothetical protein